MPEGTVRARKQQDAGATAGIRKVMSSELTGQVLFASALRFPSPENDEGCKGNPQYDKEKDGWEAGFSGPGKRIGRCRGFGLI